MQRDDVNDTTKHVTKTQASRKRSGTRQGVPGTKSCNWSRQLACATCGGGRSEAGHCFHLLFFFFGPGGLRAPCIAWPLLLPSFSLSSSLRLLLLTHRKLASWDHPNRVKIYAQIVSEVLKMFDTATQDS